MYFRHSIRLAVIESFLMQFLSLSQLVSGSDYGVRIFSSGEIDKQLTINQQANGKHFSNIRVRMSKGVGNYCYMQYLIIRFGER